MSSRARLIVASIAVALAGAALPSSATLASDHEADIVVAEDGTGDYRSLVEGVAAAEDGDTITVLPGRYEGQVRIGSDISVVGSGDRADIVVASAGPSEGGRGEWVLVGLVELHGSRATVAGLTVRGAIATVGGSPTLRDLAADQVVLRASTDAVVEGSAIRGGIEVVGGTATIRATRAESISLDASTGVLAEGNEVRWIRVAGSGAVLRDNAVGRPGGGREGIAVFIGEDSVDTMVESNTVKHGQAGIAALGPGVELRGNTVEDNRVGVVIGDAGVVIDGNTICDNTRDVAFVRGAEVDLEGNTVCEPAPGGGTDGTLVADADGLVFEDVEPGVRRLVHDGAGHFPSEPYVIEARDMDQLFVDPDGRVHVWSTTHGIDNELAGDSQHWILGQPGLAELREGDRLPDSPDPTAASGSWAAGREALAAMGPDAPRLERRLAAGPGDWLWAILRTPEGRFPARFDGQAWTIFGDPGLVGTVRSLESGQGDPDGRLWFHSSRGLSSFDGSISTRHLAGKPINTFAVGPDGRVWVATSHEEPGPGAIYVIEPGRPSAAAGDRLATVRR